MKQNTMIIVATALLLGGVIGYFITGKDCPFMGGMDHSMMMQSNSNEPDDRQMPGMDHSAMMVESEREFVVGMIPHHQEAVDTATEVLTRGGSTEEIRMLAKDIVAAQEREIAMLKQWHENWYGEKYVENDSYQPMMRDLSQLAGAELDKRFLTDMIPHHMGAIMMAKSVRPFIEHQEITAMADAIMETQTVEIRLMGELLKEL